MDLTDEIKSGINTALNEAKILGIEFNPEKQIVAVTFEPVAINADGKIPEDNRVQCIFKPVGRFIASYRNGRWDDEKAVVQKFKPEEIFKKVQEFGQLPIYGWEFVDTGDLGFNTWKNKLSFDFTSDDKQGLSHTIDLFQDDFKKFISIRIWFDEIELYDSKYEKIPLQDFIDNGERGWSQDNAKNFGIFPIKDSSGN